MRPRPPGANTALALATAGGVLDEEAPAHRRRQHREERPLLAAGGRAEADAGSPTTKHIMGASGTVRDKKPLWGFPMATDVRNPVDIGTLITRSATIRGGRPRIAGTGVTVIRIAGWYKQGMAPEEIAEEIPPLTLAQVHAALAYYHANRAEIDADLACEAVEYERLAQPRDALQ